jgi:type II secretory pathway pseudopilin PulG
MTILIKKRGYTLIEMVLYVSILALFFVVIVNSLISFTRPYREVLALRLLDRSGLESLERITRDIKTASSVDVINSVLGVSPGTLVLTATYSGVSTTTKFYLDGGVLKVDVNGIYEGPLTSASTTVSSLIFYRMTNTISSAIKVDMTLQTSISSTTKTKIFHTTAVLKGV